MQSRHVSSNILRHAHVCPHFIGVLFPFCNVYAFCVEFLRNIALNGTAIQVSTRAGTKPEFAIDGNVDGDMRHKSCIRTDTYQDYPWWKVTFKYEILVMEVIIVNRALCCGKLLNCVIYPFSFCNLLAHVTCHDSNWRDPAVSNKVFFLLRYDSYLEEFIII